MEKTHTHKVSRAAVAIAAGAALFPLASQAQGDLTFDQIAQREILRRTQNVNKSDELLAEARKAYTDKDFKKSVALYRQALSVLPGGRKMNHRRAYLTESLSQASVAYGKTLTRQGDRKQAIEVLEGVLRVDPNNAGANTALDDLYDPVKTEPAASRQHAVKVDGVRRHLYKGESFYNLGDYDNAIKEFDKVLRIDKYNQAARRWQKRVHAEKRDYFRSAYDEARARLLTAVDEAWEIKPVAVSGIVRRGRGETTVIEPGRAVEIRRKLKDTIIPTLDLEDSTLSAAIIKLQQEIRTYDKTADPAKKGVSIVIRRPIPVGALAPEPIRIDSLRLRNMPASAMLEQICQKCSPRMRVKIEEFVVAIVDAEDPEGSEVFDRQYQVPPDFEKRITSERKAAASPDPFAPVDDNASVRQTLIEAFKAMGVNFKGTATVRFIPATSTVFATNTAVELDKIERIIDEFRAQEPTQISITAKFVEINQQDNDELGFDWVISPFGLTGNSMFLGGGNISNGVNRTATNFNAPVNNVQIPGIPASGSITNTPTSGLRSGDTAITRDSINFFLNNPTRTAQSSQVAPGILSLTGLFSDGQVQMIMRGLAQKKGTDVMNAPNVLAKSGETARIEVVREFIYPTEYDPPEIPDSLGNLNNNGGGGGGNGQPNQFQIIPITPATPTAFEMRPTGVILEVTPSAGVGADKRTISLELNPEIVEFEGFINYGSPIQAVGVDALGNPVSIVVTENRIEMPVFSKRKVKSNLTIFDGHTVSVGGLMSEEVQKVEDKVPVLGDIPLLGRLFQSNAENRIKSNLVIFVTANIVDTQGRRRYSDEQSMTPTASSTSMVVPDLLAPTPPRM